MTRFGSTIGGAMLDRLAGISLGDPRTYRLAHRLFWTVVLCLA